MPDTSSPPLKHYVSVVRRQAWLVIGVTAIAVGTAALLSLYVQESVYRASMKIVVGQGGGVFQPQYGGQALPFTQTMTNLLESDIVASTVIDNLQLNETPKGLLGNLKVTTRTESSVLQLSYTSTRGGQAVAILSEVGTVFGRLVDQKLGSGAEGTRPGQDPLVPISVSVFDPAHLEPEAISPQPRRTMLASGALGFLIGLVLAFARAALDDRIRGRRDAEAWFGAPVIGTLPKGLGKRPYGLAGDPPPQNRAVLEALYRLRANLQFSQGGIAGPVLAVTSAVADESHTQVAANVGVGLALAGYDVVCVEADLRRPQLARSLGVTGAVLGVVDVLAGKVALEQALEPVQLGPPSARAATNPLRRIVRRYFGGNGAGPAEPKQDEADAPSVSGSLQVLPVGRAPANPTDVFTPERAAALLKDLRSRAQYIVIDTPPLLVFGDAFPVLRLADSVVVVAPDGQATRGVAVSVRSTLESLGVRRFSVVLTGVHDERDADGYGDPRRAPDSGEIKSAPSQTV
jgi:capsular polysaccharide biosynthesis protein/Mrp family chromosome partitioning ATPase